MKILVTGKGGREHAILSALKRTNPDVELFACPGSDAIASLATRVSAANPAELVSWMQAQQIDLCVAGEESWLVTDEGLANLCAHASIPCWGPRREAAQLEASKAFAKDFLCRHRIPTASHQVCTDAKEARAAAQQVPIVLKFDGLAAGKGVAVCENAAQVEAFISQVMEQRIFGPGNLVVEECLVGPEISVFASLSSGSYQVLMPARDYKRIGDADQGPNTGGMGAVACRDIIPGQLLERIDREIIRPTVDGLISDGLDYRGFLYFGLMLTADGPKVIEYNCRFGDPEAEAVMPLLRGNLASYLLEAARGNLQPSLIDFSADWSVCVISASAGYPASSSCGDLIHGLDGIEGAQVFHCGTRQLADGQMVTNGGRVLAVVAQAPTREEARSLAYQASQGIHFAGMQRRSDIARLHFED